MRQRSRQIGERERRLRTGATLTTLLLGLIMVLLPASGAQAQTADQGTSAETVHRRAARWDWVSDRRHFEVGDVITILIDEYTLASANKSSQALRDNQRRSSVGGTLDAGRGVQKSAGARYDSGNRGESRERGQTTRSDRISAEMTVRVVAVEPNGTLRVEGQRKMLIDEHEQEVILAGYLRPEDVSARNVVESWRLADAEISYRSNGALDRPRGGIISRIIGFFWP